MIRLAGERLHMWHMKAMCPACAVCMLEKLYQLQHKRKHTHSAEMHIASCVQDDYMTATKQLTEKLSPQALNLKREW